MTDSTPCPVAGDLRRHEARMVHQDRQAVRRADLLEECLQEFLDGTNLSELFSEAFAQIPDGLPADELLWSVFRDRRLAKDDRLVRYHMEPALERMAQARLSDEAFRAETDRGGDL